MKRFLDTNVWLALALPEHPGHLHASDWFSNIEHEKKSLLFCRSTEISFLRLLSSEKILSSMNCEPLSNYEAIDALQMIQRHPMVDILDEPLSTKKIWLQLAARPSASPNLWMDAYLAAFAIAGELRIVTFDKGFRQFQSQGLKLDLLS